MMKEKEGPDLAGGFAALPQEASSNQPCPPPALIWETVRLEAPASDRRRVVEHVANCGSCAAAWRLAREISQSAPRSGSLASRRGVGRRVAWAALATAAILIIGLSLIQLQQIRNETQSVHSPAPELPKMAVDRSVGGPGYRDSDGTAIFSRLEPGKALPRDHCLLQWRVEPDTGGVEYQIQVLDESLNPISSNGRLSETEFLVPAQKLANLPAGSRLVWQLRAEWPDGQKRSATFSSLIQ